MPTQLYCKTGQLPKDCDFLNDYRKVILSCVVDVPLCLDEKGGKDFLMAIR